MPSLESEHIVHVIKARRPPDQPFGCPECTASKVEAVGRAMGDFDALAVSGEQDRVFADDVARLRR